MGYAAYFLIVADFVRYAREQGIATTCRGSAPGSIVSYALGITPVDPLHYELPFERFLNVERVTMPDIDIDFEDGRRDEVIRYVSQKYGEDRVAQIITFGTMAARASIRDVGRVLGKSYSEVDRIAKSVPAVVNISLAEARKFPEFAAFADGAEYGQLGVISRSGEIRSLGFGASIMAAIEESYTLSLAMLRGLGRLITGQANKGEMGGPVKIAEITGEAAQNALDERGFIQFLILIAALSINLGFINLMPVPALDGGHLMFFGLEAVMRRPLSPKYQEWVMRLGIAFLLTLILMFTFFDVISWVTSPC
ncbi:MAG: hypothetical protein EBT93_12965 [Alphaproteobacteria bacterium]|nr:hypothetical protein [Alphaproteobacteria bacterium]